MASAPIRVTTLVSGLVALAGTLCLWWLYFRGEPIARAHAARTQDRVYAGSMGVNGLLFMIAGLIALAAGNAIVIDHPSREATLAVVLMLFGDPAVFLAAQAWYQWRVVGLAPPMQLLTIGVIAAAGAAGVRTVPALVAALGVIAILGDS